MNVTFKIMRRSGDKAYILSEITDYDKGLPVVLSASTENGVRIPCDVFPFVDEDDVLAMAQCEALGARIPRDHA